MTNLFNTQAKSQPSSIFNSAIAGPNVSNPSTLDGLDGFSGKESGVGSGGLLNQDLQTLTTDYTLNTAANTTLVTQANSSLIIDSITIPDILDNTPATARNMDILTGLKKREGHVGSGDTIDFYSFDLSRIRDVTLTLGNLEGNASLRLIHDKNNNNQIDAGEVVASSNRSGERAETINKVLNKGNYFAEIKQDIGSSSYEFRGLAKAPQVKVDVTRIRAIDNPDNGLFGNRADYYSKITIDGSTKTTGHISNDNDISPSNWTHSRSVSGNSRYVNIGIEVFDKDGGLAGADDRIDVDSKTGYRDINVWYDLLTNQVSGDVSGYGGSSIASTGGGDSDKAKAWFKVTEGDWYDHNLGDNHITNLARNFVYDSVDGMNRSAMIEILEDTTDYGVVNGTELADVRKIVDSFYLQDHVENLADKVVNGDIANTRAGIGNLYSGVSSSRMNSLVGKWFYGSDRPDTTSAYQYAGGSLFQNGISYTDVDQGGVGDCYFIAALGAAAKDKPYVISNMFTDNEDGTFTVRFFKPDGSRDYVTVDRYLPTVGGNARYAGWGGGHVSEADNELWVALAEKAYAQVNESGWIGQDNTNSYSGIAFGWMDKVINQISNLDTTSKNATAMTKGEAIGLVNSSKMLTVGFVNGTIPGVVNQHAYTVTSYNSYTGKFRLHNPWGSNHADVTWNELQSMQGWFQYSNV
ncbi:MAG: C2 family cysteine protease [Cyanobacteria bacterium P01_F01_bin.150]